MPDATLRGTRTSAQHLGRWPRAKRLVAVCASACSAALLVSGVSSAAPHAKSKSATVVQVVTRSPFGQMLATVKGLSLYVDPSGPCTGSCLTIWPPLLMPKRKTMPIGTSGLGTVKIGKHLQVTYNGEALYTFSGDSGSSVNGNGVGGFMVAST